MRAHLQKNGFTPQAAAAAAKNYRETVEYLAREAEPDTDQSDHEHTIDADASDAVDAQGQAPPTHPVPSRRDVFSLAEGEAILQVPEPLSSESVQDLHDWLQLIVKRYQRLYPTNPTK